MSCSESTRGRARRSSITPHATCGAWRAPRHWWRPSAEKSRQLETLPCLRVRWGGGGERQTRTCGGDGGPPPFWENGGGGGWTNNLAENSMRPVALGRKNWI